MIPLSRLGFGGGPIGNLYAEVSDVDAFGALEAAWDAGVRYFDTAPHYGLGLSERRIGAFLADRPRDGFVVSTKVGRVLEPAFGDGDDRANGFAVPATAWRRWDFSADGVRRSLESSLDRLGLDRVDVVYVHDPDAHWEQAVSEAVPALLELRSQGVIGAVGVGMNQWEMPARFVRETDLDVVLLAGRYTVLERTGEPLLDLCAARGVAVVAAGVFNSGLLARPEVGDTYDYRAAPASLVERARRIAAVCARHGVTLPQAAVSFPFRHPAVVSVLLGVRTAAEMLSNAAAASTPVPDSLWSALP
ncbi:D-threo-aldose 1-dehydrogenase [Saccharothrix saharensis]|uniref:D-threo-aldose 1-dehydrogenase n=1 Tax=Saccharothrix saharensis TaxID=571190 RepID=A0A543JFE5_9PSEU|nr:aldo/keto reductase [Saccharothrix saharensis]TQM81514.1 D-threo-aldose 1-dehydrogenase [Saccharothrix saharensis]